MNYSRSMDYLFSLDQFRSDLSLERIEEAMEKLGNPERRFRDVHVAGTNGKGSVTAILSSVLKECGYRVGTFTSPHLIDIRERIRVDGEMIGKGDFARLFNKVRSAGVRLTFFEYVTAIAFEYFRVREVDIAVIEVGLGGRLDATNVITPIVSVITNVRKDHTHILGKEIREIAMEKAGIIKESVPVVTNSKDEALEVIKGVAGERNAPVIEVPERVKVSGHDLEKQTVVYGGKDFYFGLLGKFQAENLNTALTVLDALGPMGFGVKESGVRKGMEKVRWEGRFEVVGRDPLFILDSAHNPDGIKALADSLKDFEYERMILVFGVKKTKNYRDMSEVMDGIADEIILTRAEIRHALEPEELRKAFSKECTIERDPKRALSIAKERAGKGELVLVTGSIYLIGNVKRELVSRQKITADGK